MLGVVDQLQADDQQVVMLDEADRRPPALPAFGPAASVERRSKNAYGNLSLHASFII